MARRKGMTPERAERVAKVMQMQQDGIPFAQIGKKLGVSTQQASMDYRAGVRELFRGSLEEHVLLELARLNEVHRIYRHKLMGMVQHDATVDATGKGKHTSPMGMSSVGGVILQASKQRCKLLALDGAMPMGDSASTHSPLAELAKAIRGESTPLDDLADTLGDDLEGTA